VVLEPEFTFVGILVYLHTFGYPSVGNAIIKPIICTTSWYRVLRVYTVIFTKTHEEGISVKGELLLCEFFWHLNVLED
jgi:hypothetical protein